MVILSEEMNKLLVDICFLSSLHNSS